jgi:DNA replication protein DnaC
MSQPTYDRLVSHLDRPGLARAKEILPEVLSAAEQSSDGHAAVLDRLFEEEIAAREERRVDSH